MQISKRVQQIAASQSLAMAARAKEMQAAGIDVISMSLGEPDLDTPIHVRRAAQEAIDNHWSHYGPVAGIPALRAAIADRQNSAAGNAIRWEANDVLVSVGAKMAIFNAVQAAINPGDEVIIPMPSWVSYTEMVKLAEGVVVPVETKYEDDYSLTADQLRAALTDKTRMLIICSPNNPTGSIYSREQLEAARISGCYCPGGRDLRVPHLWYAAYYMGFVPRPGRPSYRHQRREQSVRHDRLPCRMAAEQG